jgi:YVTN family beta-propeller protein
MAGAVLRLARIEAEATSGVRSNQRSRQSRIGIKAKASAGLLAGLVAVSGCGNTYRPVVTAINPVGPASQPQKYALAVSDPGNGLPGLVTIVDFSGDTVLITANVGVSPYFFWLNATGTTGYTLNADGTMTSFDVSNSLQTRDMISTTLLSGALPNSIFADTASVYITESGRGAVAQLTGTPPALRQELPIPSGYSPVYIAGFTGVPRQYVISQNTSGANGLVSAIDTTSSTISGTIPVGRGPVYGVMTSDGKRAFVLNKTDGTVTVLNAQANTLDAVPAPAVNPIPVGSNPIWADFASTRNELVVANAGDGTAKGTVSIISIPLCSVAVLPGNPNCNATNPTDAAGFGQVLATVPVGVDPQMVAVLQDGTRAYVVNKADSTISVVNLNSNRVTATIPVPSTVHPNFIAAISGTPTGKIYVTSPESNNMTIIRTDTDVVETTIPLQGKAVQVRAQLP